MSHTVELKAADLNGHGGVFCPNPKADMKLWNSHPKVYVDVAKTGEAKCPLLRHGLQTCSRRTRWRPPLKTLSSLRRSGSATR